MKFKVVTVMLILLLISMLTLAFNIQQVKADWWSTPAQLTSNTATDSHPFISGDGGKIAFLSNRDGDFEIFVVNSDGSGLKQLTSNTATEHSASISGDGGKIAFASDVDGDFEIFVVNSDGSGLKQLTSNTATDHWLSISGDGGKIAFTSDVDGDFEIWVISAQAQLTIEVVGLGTTNPAAGSYFYDEGSVVNVDAQPEVGWVLDHWLLDGVFVEAADPLPITMDADHTLSAVFEAWTPPVASFTYSPSAPEVGETVSFDASGSSDDDGYITSYAWDFGDENSGTGKTTSHAYATVASYTVTLTVTDNDGLTDTATKGFDVYAGPQNDVDVTKPHADARTSDQTVEVGTTVTCDASGCSDNVGVVSYEWDFGDGTTETGVIATHTYTEEGTYAVALTVRDAAGNSDTDTLKITVRKAAAPFPLWVLAPIIGGITGGTAVLVYLKRRKPKEEVPKPAEPIITAEPTEISVPAKKTEEVLKPPEEIPPQKVKGFPKLSAKCSDTITLLNSFIEDPSRINDRKAWKGFREFVAITEQIEDEYAELLEIRNKLAVLRRKRNEYRSAGLDDLADKTEGVIQSNYGDSIRIIKEIREKLPQLGG
jgi:PKD repeat protein